MSKESVHTLLEMETKKLEKLEKEKITIQGKINESKSKVEKYKLMSNNEKFTEISEALSTSGFSLEDIMKALKEGNFSSLQSKAQ